MSIEKVVQHTDATVSSVSVSDCELCGNVTGL